MNLQTNLTDWFKSNRKQYSWRDSDQPYPRWISEIILQQTRTAQAEPYYIRFIEKFPDLDSLAKADIDEVLKKWQGLGYYSRAKNLHHGAKYIKNTLYGNFPNSFEELLKVKGIGKYTAGAVASICFKEPVPAIDGNAFRVYSRYFDIEKDISKSTTFKYFFDLGKSIIPKNNPGDFNEAIMELGATICIPKNPKCEDCPIQQGCVAFKDKKQHLLPVKTKKIKVKKQDIHYYLFLDPNSSSLLLKRRDETSIWKNLYDLPEKNDSDLGQNLIFNLQHLLTHKKLNIDFHIVTADHKSLKKMAKIQDSLVLIKTDELENYALPRPVEKFFEHLKLI